LLRYYGNPEYDRLISTLALRFEELEAELRGEHLLWGQAAVAA
jgi:hypothetical protein